MPAIEDDGPLELSDATDFVTDGTARIEILREDTARIVYFYWRVIEGVWRRVAASHSRICPISSLHFPITALPDVQIVTRTKRYTALHS